MERIVKQAHMLLIKEQKTIALAESCTGGLLSKLLTDNPGSSKYLILGVTAYSNTAKNKLLKIPASLIVKYGAVSKAVADEMAKKVRKIAKADLGIGITGIAGPTGGTKYKPLGNVFISVQSKNKKTCKEFHFKGTRAEIREKSALEALRLLLDTIKS
jgi:PncC family amidohydrolase